MDVARIYEHNTYGRICASTKCFVYADKRIKFEQTDGWDGLGTCFKNLHSVQGGYTGELTEVEGYNWMNVNNDRYHDNQRSKWMMNEFS